MHFNIRFFANSNPNSYATICADGLPVILI
jgi:hypothetical protein